MDNLSRNLRDPHAQKLSCLWFERRLSLTDCQKDQIGGAYLRHIIGLDDEEIQRFVEYDKELHRKVGEYHAGSKKLHYQESREFWQAVREVESGLCPDEDLDWLVKVSEQEALSHPTHHLLFQIDPAEGPIPSHAVRAIHNNMITYK